MWATVWKPEETIMKKLLIAIGLIVVLGIGFAAWKLSSDGGVVVEIPQSEIQKQLETTFPLEKSYVVLKVILSDPQVQLHKGTERVHFSTAVAAGLAMNVKPVGKAEVSGKIDYDPASGQFFLVESTLESIEVAGLPKEYQDQTRQAASAIIREALNRFPLYKLDETDRVHSLAKTFLKSVQVGDNSLRVTLGLR
jgi:hypothetical protein